VLFTLVFLIFCGVLEISCWASPDLNKAYQEGVNWAQDLQQKQPVPGKRCAVSSSQTPCMQSLQEVTHNEIPTNIDVRCQGRQRKALGLGVSSIPKMQEEKKGQSVKNTDYQILVFISFSLPKLSLQKLRLQAAELNAQGRVRVRLIAKGLLADSFKKTAMFLMEGGKELTNENQVQGINLNPKLFTAYSIVVAPTFVYLKKGKPVKRLSGNVCLDFVCQKFGVPSLKKVQA